nr:hypothetical protein [uncultured Pseudomonas sp.]
MTPEQKLIMATTDAITLFTKLYDTAVVSGGPVYSRDGGSAVLDCFITKNRIIVMTLDSKPDQFAIAVAQKDVDEEPAYEVFPQAELTASKILNYMEAHFAK